MLKSLFLTSLVLVSFAANANLDNYFNRYGYIRSSSGELVAVRDRSLFAVFKIAPYLKHLQQALRDEQQLLSQKGDYDAQIAGLFVGDEMENGVVASDRDGVPTDVKAIIASMKGLSQLDVDYIFEHSDFKDVIANFEKGMTNVLQKLDPMVLARLDDPKFFYKRAVTVGVVKAALNYARKKLRNIPMLTVASYTILQIDELIRERRLYHQNALLHYLEAFSEEELKLTEKERRLILSSIYESRIGWMNFIESKNAVKSWDRYGVNKFYGSIQAANNDFRRNGAAQYTTIDERLNYAFQEVSANGVKMIVNLFHKDSMYSKKFAVAFYPESPYRVFRKRVVLQLAEMGVNLINIKPWYKNQLVRYMRSMYETQRLTEGALFGHFESTGNSEMMKAIMMQNVNPYESFKLD